jgi:hypothetical protein
VTVYLLGGLQTHNDPSLRVASVWAIINLAWADAPGATQRVATLRRAGIDTVLGRLTGTVRGGGERSLSRAVLRVVWPVREVSVKKYSPVLSRVVLCVVLILFGVDCIVGNMPRLDGVPEWRLEGCEMEVRCGPHQFYCFLGTSRLLTGYPAKCIEWAADISFSRRSTGDADLDVRDRARTALQQFSKCSL